MAVATALGLISMGGGSLTLGQAPNDVAAMLIAFFPVYPLNSSDNRLHLQVLSCDHGLLPASSDHAGAGLSPTVSNRGGTAQRCHTRCMHGPTRACPSPDQVHGARGSKNRTLTRVVQSLTVMFPAADSTHYQSLRLAGTAGPDCRSGGRGLPLHCFSASPKVSKQ